MSAFAAEPAFRAIPLNVPSSGRTGFRRLSQEETGITFTNVLSRSRQMTNQIYLSGSGVAAGDVDGDGLCDLYFCGLDRPNVLYRNLGGWRFEDITARAGVACRGLDSTGAAFADIDGDGDLDLIVNSVGGGTHIFLNNGKGVFTELSPGSPINPRTAGMSLTLADIDGDGDLDLFVANYRTTTIRDMPRARIQGKYVDGIPIVASVNDRPTTDPDLVGRFMLDANGSILENGDAPALFLNDGKGHFSQVSFTDGTFLDEEGRRLSAPPFDWGLSAMFRDLNGDGFPDLYVCNDFQSPDRIWMNDGKGHFRAIAPLAVRHTSKFSMGVDVADINRDGHDDLFIVDMLSRSHVHRQVQVGQLTPYFSLPGVFQDRPQYSHNTLLLNRGDGTYAETAYYSGVEASEWSWTPIFLDVDLDGYEDLLITNGAERDGMNGDVIQQGERLKKSGTLSERELLEINSLFPRLDTPNAAFRNRGPVGKFTFEDVSAAWGFDFADVCHGMALADLDNDGDLDVVINTMNGPAGIFRNTSSRPRIAVRLKGLSPNTRGIGARIILRGGAVETQAQEMICGGRYLSADDNMRVFAVGSSTNGMTLEVLWRGGKRSVIADVKANYLYEIDERGAESWERPKAKAESKALFEDVTSLLSHRHTETSFDDFVRQPLLPNKLSQLGPGVAWHDVDQDGWEDLIIGSGQGGTLAVFHNDHHGGFALMTNAVLARPVSRDQTTPLGLKGALLVGSSNYEDGSTNGGAMRIYDLARGASGESVLGQSSSTGPMALADIDNDGDLDLFIGGRVIPGRYPESADSILLRNDGGRFVPAQRFEKLGLISGAVFSDLDGDGKLELIMASEWGPIRVFRNVSGHFEEVTAELGLGRYLGWWNGITTGDFDGDGKLDIAASNWGLNSHYHASAEEPRRLYFGDLTSPGSVDLIESYIEAGRELPDRNLRIIGGILPFVSERMPTFSSYARASVQEIYGERLAHMRMLEANTLATMVFLNRGDHFEPVVLPPEAQWSPAFAISVSDFDGDGREDIFLGQNFFSVNQDHTRQDGGRGLLLKGDGKGNFTSLPGQTSGVIVYGEQRGCAVCDYDQDGRVDLVVTQNGAETKLYHNTGAKPGLRVLLRGGTENPKAIGASMRLVYADHSGPLREIHAGSGYWSQDSAVQVLGKSGEPTHLWVRWPGGNSTRTELPPGILEVEVDATGKLVPGR